MIVGHRLPPIFCPSESGITKAYERLNFVDHRFFVVHVGGRRYGVYESLDGLRCSRVRSVRLKTVLRTRGSHTVPFAGDDAGEIARSFRSALYAEIQEVSYFGIL